MPVVPFIPLIAAGLGAAASALGGRSKTANQQQNQTSTTNQTQNINATDTSSPNFSPLQQQLINMFTGGASDLFNSTTNLRPYTSAGLQGIAGQGNANRSTIGNILASRGLSYSPVAANALTMNALNTGNQQANFMAQVPLLQRQLQQGSLQQLMQAFSALPTAVSNTRTGTTSTQGTTTGTGTTTGEQGGGGGILGGLLGGLGSLLPLAGDLWENKKSGSPVSTSGTGGSGYGGW